MPLLWQNEVEGSVFPCGAAEPPDRAAAIQKLLQCVLTQEMLLPDVWPDTQDQPFAPFISAGLRLDMLSVYDFFI